MTEPKEYTCDMCRRLFEDHYRKYYCVHCKTFFSICPSCQKDRPKCSICGILLTKRREHEKVKK